MRCHLLGLALAATLLGLPGCVRTHSDMLDERTIVISGRGTAWDSAGGVQKAVLQEAAKRARAAGYEYFVIYNSQDQTRRGVLVTPGQTFTSGTVSANCTGAFCSGGYTGQTTTTPGSAVAFATPGIDIYVKFYNAGEIDPKTPGLWNVTSVLWVAGGNEVPSRPLPAGVDPYKPVTCRIDGAIFGLVNAATCAKHWGTW